MGGGAETKKKFHVTAPTTLACWVCEAKKTCARVKSKRLPLTLDCCLASHIAGVFVFLYISICTPVYIDRYAFASILSARLQVTPVQLLRHQLAHTAAWRGITSICTVHLLVYLAHDSM